MFGICPIPNNLVLWLFSCIPVASSNILIIEKYSIILTSLATIKLLSSAKPNFFIDVQGKIIGFFLRTQWHNIEVPEKLPKKMIKENLFTHISQ